MGKILYYFSNMHREFRFFLILSLFISLVLEITLFNYTHYATLFTSERFSVDSPYILEQDSILFPNLNTKIASIYIDPIFIWGDKQRIKVIWADEESSERSINVSIIKDLDFSNYITVAPIGKVSNLNIEFVEDNIAVKQVELNKTIPRAIMPIRMVIVFGISLLLLCLRNAELREKISYFCFDYLYDKASFKQRAGFAALICSMLVFNFLATYSVYGFKDNEIFPKWVKMYSHQMTDALIKRQVHLDVEVPKALQEAERPYDDVYRRRHGVDVGDVWDGSYYKGKYYSYFEMLPVIILFAPYKLLTGDYLPNGMGKLLFCSIATILLMLLWKQIAQNYLKKLPYFFFLIGGATLYASSLIPIHLERNIFHIIAQYSALAFVFFGVIMLLRAMESGAINRTTTYLFISSFSFALAVACRPSALFFSILIPVVLWAQRKEINVSKVLAIIVPFVIVGSILAWYNYARFDSPFEFGVAYSIGFYDFGALKQSGIIRKIWIVVREIVSTLFNPPNLDLTFPFVREKTSNIPLADISVMHFRPMVGIFCFPVMWFLFYVKKVEILRNFVLAGIFISLLNIIVVASVNFIDWRYSMDFSWILAICALICAFQLQEKEAAMRKIILKIFYLCCTFTLLLSFFFTIPYFGRAIDPNIYHYLARTFGVICNVP